MSVQTVTVIGCGLIGGSIAAATKKYGLAKQVIGTDVSESMLDMALSRQVIDMGTTDLSHAVLEADLIVIAVPVQQTLKILQLLSKLSLKPGAIVTDVGSTKTEICRSAKRMLPESVHFIGGHPMAGSERSGVRAANEQLFENAVYVLTPDTTTDAHALCCLSSFIEGLRAKIMHMNPEHHDRVVGTISHLPHVVASALVRFVSQYAEEDTLYAQLAAGGFRDVTRIASGNPDMWRDILLMNHSEIDGILSSFIDSCMTVRDLIRTQHEQEIRRFLADAKDWRDALPIRKRGAVPEVYQCALEVPDRPGIIAHIATILADQEISLRNIGILESREEENGQLLLQFNRLEELDQAVQVLTKQNMQVHVYGQV